MRLTPTSKFFSLLFSIVLGATAACGDEGGGDGADAIEIVGYYADDYGEYTLITDAAWGAQAIISVDNDANIAVTQNASTDAYYPSKFNKVVWTEPAEGSFWVCIAAFGQDTAQAAKASANVADASNPSVSGCGGFPWTRYFAPLEISGTWASAFGTETIDSYTWASSFGTTTIVLFDNAANVAVTQNASDDAYNPSKFNRVVWTELTGGKFFYCMTDFGLDTAEEARAAATAADASNPSVSGCGGFPWSELTAQ